MRRTSPGMSASNPRNALLHFYEQSGEQQGWKTLLTRGRSMSVCRPRKTHGENKTTCGSEPHGSLWNLKMEERDLPALDIHIIS